MKMYIRIIGLLSIISFANASQQPSSANLDDATLTAHAQQAISQAFQAMDDWMNAPVNVSAYKDNNGNVYKTDIFGKVLLKNGKPVVSNHFENTDLAQSADDVYPVDAHGDSLYLIVIDGQIYSANKNEKGAFPNYGASTKSMYAVNAIHFVNSALSNLEQSVFGESLQPVKDAMQKAISAFTTESTIDNTVLRTMVNSLKLLLVAPIKAAYVAGGLGVGAAVGGVAGVIVGFGAGINRTAKNIANIYDKEMSMQDVALALPKTIIAGLRGVVSTAALTAYAAAEHVALGANTGSIAAQYTVGSVFQLNPVQQKDSINSDNKSEISTNDANNTTENNQQPSAKKVVEDILAEEEAKRAAANAHFAAQKQAEQAYKYKDTVEEPGEAPETFYVK